MPRKSHIIGGENKRVELRLYKKIHTGFVFHENDALNKILGVIMLFRIIRFLCQLKKKPLSLSDSSKI